MYMARYGVAPAESDIQAHFKVSAPSAHQMVKTLERRGFIVRQRYLLGNVVPRSIRVVVD
jgi:repressor LexA